MAFNLSYLFDKVSMFSSFVEELIGDIEAGRIAPSPVKVSWIVVSLTNVFLRTFFLTVLFFDRSLISTMRDKRTSILKVRKVSASWSC